MKCDIRVGDWVRIKIPRDESERDHIEKVIRKTTDPTKIHIVKKISFHCSEERECPKYCLDPSSMDCSKGCPLNKDPRYYFVVTLENGYFLGRDWLEKVETCYVFLLKRQEINFSQFPYSFFFVALDNGRILGSAS